MLILSLCLALLVAGITWGQSVKWHWESIGPLLLTVIGVVMLTVAIITLGTERLDVHARIRGFRAVATTIAVARESDATWEIAAFQRTIAEKNEWLARKQYWNQTIFDLWIPDAVMGLEPLR